mgnify:CR=1 FL=1|jgi:transglutaminase-like putative cysteine protease
MIGKKRNILNLTGILIVIFWVVMLSILFRKHYLYNDPVQSAAINVKAGEARQDWKEIFLNNKKVGYAVTALKPFEGGYYIQDELFLKLNLMGFEKGLYTITQASVDESFRLKNFFFKMNSGVINYRITGKVEGNLLKITTGTGRRGKVKEIRLNETPVISSGLDHMFRNIKPVPGESFNTTFFDPATMMQRQATFKVISREKIKINNIEYDTFMVEGEVMGARLNFWFDMNGDILKEQSIMGLTMVKSSPANAPLNIEDGVEDFYEVTVVRTDKKLPDTKRLKGLTIRLKGIEDTGFDLADISGERQKYINGILSVTVEEGPFRAGYRVPYTVEEPDMKKYLAPEYNIESDEDAIISKAQKIAGNIKDPVILSQKMMEWVYTNIEKRPVISIPSATEVLETMTGDCNEHAILLTALLRAVGIPARISTGLVYTRENFYYHAWVEVYTGEWITIDPTMNQFPADVSHITLLRGNIDKQVEIMAVIGKLAIEVIDFEYN